MKVIKSEMAGTLLELKVAVGASVKVGQEIAVLESMKMEVPLQSSHEGVISQVLKKVGDFVNEGESIFELS